MTEPYIEITHRDQYFELTGQTLPTCAELQGLTAGLPAVIIPCWPGECVAMFLPCGQSVPTDQVGHVVLFSPNRTLPARVFDRELTRGRWSSLNATWEMDQEVDFDTLAMRPAAL